MLFRNKNSRITRHSLSAKLVILFVLVGVLFVILMAMAIKKSYRNSFQETIRPHLSAYLDYVQNDIGLPPNIERAKKISDKLSLTISIVGDDLHWSSTGVFFPFNELEIHKKFTQQGRTIIFAEYHEIDILVLEHGKYQLFVSELLLDNAWPHREWQFIKALPFLVLIIVLVFLYHATAYIFAPLKTIQKGIQQISNGNLEHKIIVKRKDELAELANNINTMGDDIKQMLDAKRQLLLAISHELRSPLTRAKIQVEMLSDSKHSQEIKNDLNEMADLIEELLEGERLNNHQSLNREYLMINELLDDLLADRYANQNLQTKVSTIKLYADKARLRLLLKNLIENALRFTPDNQPAPEIHIWQEKQLIKIEIKDYGEGIAEQHLQHLCEPFYRVDSSRQRQTGGYGLGLYLCRMIAEAHGGKLKIKSEIGKGTLVIILLPLTEN